MVVVNISSRVLLGYGGLFVLFLSVGFVIAFDPEGEGNPAVFGHSENEIAFSGGVRIPCNWEGIFKNRISALNIECSSGKIIGIEKVLWVVDSCETAHPKGYHCRIDTGISGGYNLSCWTTSENHGEWMGSILNKVEGVTLGSSVVINYLSSTGEWELTTVGKANNHNPPPWNTKTCKAGGYA